MFICSNCQHIFSSSRGLTIHCYTCNNIYLCHNHQLRHKLFQQNIVQLAKHQSIIFYKMFSLKKKSNTNNSTQDDIDYKQLSNNRLIIASNKSYNNIIVFNNLN